MKNTTNQRRRPLVPCGWNHRRIACVLAPIALALVVRAIYLISK